MKKRLFISVSAIIIVIAMLLALSGCELNNSEYSQKYSYSRCEINQELAGEYSALIDTVELVYSDCSLKLFDDGTWVIDYPILGMFNINIDEGTYVQSNDSYFFTGFDYGDLSTYGYETADGFVIYFAVHDSATYLNTTLMTLYFTK